MARNHAGLVVTAAAVVFVLVIVVNVMAVMVAVDVVGGDFVTAAVADWKTT